MPIILKKVRLSYDIFKYDVMECDTGINGLVNITATNPVPFVTLEFCESITKQKAIRRYFMKKNPITGIYDHWDGKTPCELQTLIGIKIPGTFETREGITLFLMEHEMNNKERIEKLFEKEAGFGFDIETVKKDANVSQTASTNNTAEEQQGIQRGKSQNVGAQKEKDNNLSNTFSATTVAVILIIAVALIFSAINGALNGIAETLSSIPEWLRIVLFVPLCLLIGGGFMRSSRQRDNKND